MRIKAESFGQRIIPGFTKLAKGAREHAVVTALRDVGWPLEHDDTRPMPKQIGDAVRMIGAKRLHFKAQTNGDMLLEWE